MASIQSGDDTQDPTNENVDYLEVQKNALRLLHLERLIGLLADISDAGNSAKSDQPDIQALRAAIDHAIAIPDMEQQLHRARTSLETLKRKRSITQAHRPVAETALESLTSSISRVEESLQGGNEDMNQSEKAIELLTEFLGSNSVVAGEIKYKSLRLLPKREKVVKQVVRGPDLSFSKERVLKEGLTAEAAVKADRPMMFHKGLQKWVPLPTGDDSDNWRD